jgi:hypothetical protein
LTDFRGLSKSPPVCKKNVSSKLQRLIDQPSRRDRVTILFTLPAIRHVEAASTPLNRRLTAAPEFVSTPADHQKKIYAPHLSV